MKTSAPRRRKKEKEGKGNKWPQKEAILQKGKPPRSHGGNQKREVRPQMDRRTALGCGCRTLWRMEPKGHKEERVLLLPLGPRFSNTNTYPCQISARNNLRELGSEHDFGCT